MTCVVPVPVEYFLLGGGKHHWAFDVVAGVGPRHLTCVSESYLGNLWTRGYGTVL